MKLNYFCNYHCSMHFIPGHTFFFQRKIHKRGFEGEIGRFVPEKTGHDLVHFWIEMGIKWATTLSIKK